MIRQVMLLGITSLLVTHTNAQISEWEFGAATFKESFFYPSKYNFIAPYHPGFSLVAEKQIKERRISNRVLSIEGGFYHHRYWQNGFFLLGGYNFEYPLKEKFKLRWGPRLGYLHTFSPTGKYRHIDSEFRQIRDWGRPTAMLGLVLGAEYSVNYTNDPRRMVDIFFNYQALVEGPFAPDVGVPAVPHTLLSLGFKTKLFSKK